MRPAARRGATEDRLRPETIAHFSFTQTAIFASVLQYFCQQCSTCTDFAPNTLYFAPFFRRRTLSARAKPASAARQAQPQVGQAAINWAEVTRLVLTSRALDQLE